MKNKAFPFLINFVLVSFILLTNGILYAIDNPHFYRSTYFLGEPRLVNDWLTTIDFSCGAASTDQSRNSSGHTVPLLDIYGLHNMQLLGAGVPLDPTNPLDQILINLENLPARGTFGQLEFSGNFHCVESTFNIYQNLINGFFLQAYFPIRTLKISDIRFTDLSPNDPSFPNKFTPEWQAFLSSFGAILNRFNLSIGNVHRTGLGDLTLLAGWAGTYLNTEILDFIDVDASVGILFPTAKRRNEHRPFDLPLGYNGYFGAPLRFNCDLGLWEWLTAGFHIDALFLFERTKELSMKTAQAQSGLINLAHGKAKVDPGTYWDISLFTKADHFAKGFSLLLGYTFSKKDRDGIRPVDTTLFDPRIVNGDPRFKSWRMHVMHFLAEYDFAKKASDIGPRVGFFYNLILKGQRIFKANMKSAYIGIDVEWCL